MVDRGDVGGGSEETSILVPLSEFRRERLQLPVTFHRKELDLLLNMYGKMVAAGEWRDYAISHLRDLAVFSAFRRAAETCVPPALGASQAAREALGDEARRPFVPSLLGSSGGASRPWEAPSAESRPRRLPGPVGSKRGARAGLLGRARCHASCPKPRRSCPR